RDLLVTEGIERWKPKEDRIPVSDGAGEIVKIGKSGGKFKVGDKVTTLIHPNWSNGTLTDDKIHGSLGGSSRDGVLSEYVVLPENALARFPDYLNYVEAATLPVAALTAWNAVVEQSPLKLGATILITGTGGVSIFALQFAKLAGYKIIVTSSSDEKLKRAEELGAHYTINYKTHPDWTEEVLKITQNIGADQVIDVVGGNHLDDSLKCVKSEGVVSMIGLLFGTTGLLNTGTIMSKAAKIQGVETGSTEMYERMLTAMAIHQMRPVIDRVFPFTETAEAFSFLKNNKPMGKICIQLNH
ncbi:MAG: NAD(P)-dependent alcohol dehydrogenase, partial [Pricia sp.]|nr:NAD(P)-dependent alcohol dehydrogenase [Pricia sp.]